MPLEQIEYYGYAAFRLRGAHLTLDFLAQAGPRLVGLRLPGSEENILGEYPALSWPSPHGAFHAYGGHRLWQSPEFPEKTYFPDDSGLEVQELKGGVLLSGAFEPATGIGRAMTVTLDPAAAALTVAHHIRNESGQALTLAPWAITQLPLGGAAFLPQTVGVFPPGEPAAVFWANRHLALWNYTRWDDPRLRVADDHIRVAGDAIAPPCKIGYFNTSGWAAYLRQGVLFVKQFTPLPGSPHPDRDCNVEVYVNDLLFELETLGPLATLQPGAQVTHIERWVCIAGMPDGAGFAQVEKIVEKL